MRKEVHLTMRKGWNSGALIFAVTLLVTGGIAHAGFVEMLDVDPGRQIICVGETATIDILVTGASEFWGYDLSVTFDSSIVQFVDAQYTTFMGDPDALPPTAWNIPPDASVPGVVALAQSHLGSGSPGISGDGIIVTLTFLGIAEGVSPIDLTNVRLLGLVNGQITEFFGAEVTGGAILVRPCDIPEPGTIALLLGGLGAIGLRRRNKK